MKAEDKHLLTKRAHLRALHRKMSAPPEKRPAPTLVNRALQARRTMRPNL